MRLGPCVECGAILHDGSPGCAECGAAAPEWRARPIHLIDIARRAVGGLGLVAAGLLFLVLAWSTPVVLHGQSEDTAFTALWVALSASALIFGSVIALALFLRAYTYAFHRDYEVDEAGAQRRGAVRAVFGEVLQGWGFAAQPLTATAAPRALPEPRTSARAARDLFRSRSQQTEGEAYRERTLAAAIRTLVRSGHCDLIKQQVRCWSKQDDGSPRAARVMSLLFLRRRAGRGVDSTEGWLTAPLIAAIDRLAEARARRSPEGHAPGRPGPYRSPASPSHEAFPVDAVVAEVARSAPDVRRWLSREVGGAVGPEECPEGWEEEAALTEQVRLGLDRA